MAKTFYYGQKLNWYVVIGVAASTLSFAFAFNRFKDGRKGSAPWAQGLRQAFVEIWPIADESKAYLRVQIFSHWTSYRSVFSILYFTLISFASISIIFLFRAQPGVGWQVFLPILTFYMILCMSPMDDVEGLPLLQSRWKSAVFHAEWIRWTAFWCLIYGLWILVLALTLPFRHPILAFALGAFLGLWITVWASYLRVRFSASTWQRCIYATLSLAIPLLIPIIVTTEKKE